MNGGITSMKKRMFLVTALIALIAVFALVGCGSSSGGGSSTIKLSECVSYRISGTNGQGTLSYSIDDDKIGEYVAKKRNIKDLEMEENESKLEGYFNDVFMIDEATTITVDKEDNLSNGDVVTIGFIVDSSLTKNLGYKIDTKSLKITVSGLQ
jgi:uncharacterized lipoprotein YehR (DUF1307 family)